MPPKKVRQTNTQDKPQQTTSKPSDKLNLQPTEPIKQQPKVQPKIIPQNNADSQPAKQVQKAPQITSQPEQEQSNSKSQKIAFDDVEKLTEQQRIRLRRLRFGIIGTDTLGSQTDKIKQERLKKFGSSSNAEDPETLEKRKKKFSNVPQITEDNQTIQQRLKKFGQVSQAIVAQDPSVIEQRRKKFGNNEKDVSLDDLIEKFKKIKKDGKGHFKKGNGHHKPYGNKFRR